MMKDGHDDEISQYQYYSKEYEEDIDGVGLYDVGYGYGYMCSKIFFDIDFIEYDYNCVYVLQ